MTTMNIVSVGDLPGGDETIKQCVDKNMSFFKQIQDHLRSDEVFEPEIQIHAISVSTIIMVQLQVNETHVTRIQDIARRNRLEHNIPRPFHITIGYLYRELDNENRTAIEKELNGIFSTLLEEYSVKKFIIKPHQLTYFNDMTAFIPWDGIANPF